jgi:TolB-like protein
MSSVYRFDRFEVKPAERRLLAGGVPARLGARAFDVLVWLIEHRDRLVTKQELLEAVWPGLVVEENNLSVQVSALRKVLGAGLIATVPGRGFHFAAEVSSDPLPFEGLPPAKAPPAMQNSSPSDFSSQSVKTAIAVLPFSVLSANPADSFLSDGLVADVTALLARVPGFLLISRASSFVFRERTASLSEVARQLGVRYMVEGSLRAQGSAVRVSAQLTDAASGHILWSGDFHSSREDAEDMQTGIARGILSQLQPELTRAEIGLIRRQRPENLTAWTHYHQAVDSIASQGWSESGLAAARAHLQNAISVAPDFGLAHAYYGMLTALGCNLGMICRWPTMKCDLLASIDEAVRLDGRNPEVLGYAGCALSDLGFHDRATDILGEAIDIDPSNAQAKVALGAALIQKGSLDNGVDLMRLGMRISPRDRRLAFWGWAMAVYMLHGERVVEALAEARSAQERDPRFYLARILEAGALARLGHLSEVHAPLRRARQLRPRLTLDEVRHTHGRRVAADVASFWDGLAV